MPLIERLSRYAERTRLKLARARGQPLLAVLGLCSGILVGAIVILFRLAIESSQRIFLPEGRPENYEQLPWDDRFIAAVAGGVVLGLVFWLVARPPPRVGVVHVIERLAYQEGHLPLKNAVLQFFGGILSIVSGHSVGREGPSVHLGAAAASLMGRRLRLPNNSIRTLIACGAAAAIAASFNTPLAGVIFAMEVVMMEYTIAGFTPVILAAVSATALSRWVFDANPAFQVPSLRLVSLWELPGIVVMGILIGAIAAALIVSVRKLMDHVRPLPIWLQMGMGGLGVGACGSFVPEVMGIGYDTVDQTLIGGMTLAGALLILFAKFIATTACIGTRLPGGVIGPSLFIGAMAGCATGLVLELLPGTVSPPGLYAMLGMGAMMGAALQAPLAALLALLELTANENIILPGMLAVVSASLATREMFGQESIFVAQMRGMGIDYRNDPNAQWLRRLAVSAVMNTSFSRVDREVPRVQAERILEEVKPQWILVTYPDEKLLLPAADLARHLEEDKDETVDMREVPSRRLQLAAVSQESTLQQALKILDDTDAEALYVVRPISASADRIYGVITRQDIEQGYRLRDHGVY